MLSIKKHITLAVIISACCITSCSSSKHSRSKGEPGVWQVQPIVIDAENNDWPSPYPNYDDKAMLGYAVSNDKDNLYVTVETGDPATQLKILRQGFTVWIDNTGGKDKNIAIHYPLKNENRNSFRTGDDQQQQRSQWQPGQNASNTQDKRRMMLEERVKTAVADANAYTLQGFKSCNRQFSVMEKDSCGIVLRVGIDSMNELIWEAKIPFRSFYSHAQINKADRGKALSVCFETVGIKRPAGGNTGGGNRGGGGGGNMRGSGMGFGGGGGGMRMGGGGGGMRGGGMHGGGGGGNSQANSIMEPLYKSTQTWKKFGIAYQE